MDRGLRLLTILAACLLSPTAVSGETAAWTIHGRIVVPGINGRAGSVPSRYLGQATSLPVADAVPRGAVTDAVVYVVSLPPTFVVTNPVGQEPELEQKGQAFHPRVLAVQSGTTVVFPNRDPVYHNVFSVSPNKRFDLGKYAKGQSRSVRFDKSGLVQVFCDIHSDMAAFILVVPHHVFARAGADGRFELPELPRGTYVLRAWHPDFGELEREVTLGPGAPSPVELRF